MTRHTPAATIATLAVAAFLTACSDVAPVAPGGLAPARARAGIAAPDLGACADIAVPAGNVLAFHTYADGVQVYKWTGTAWTFDAPEATLYADAGGRARVGTHYRGPKWESLSGSVVQGAVDVRCNVAGTIQWLRLKAVAERGPGVFDGTTFILRVNTTGGTAPVEAGSTAGEERRVPYTAEYYFYKAG